MQESDDALFDMTRDFNDSRWLEAIRNFNSHDLGGAAARCHEILAERPKDPMAHWLLASIAIESGKPRLSAHHGLEASQSAAGLGILDLLQITWTLIVTGEAKRAYELLQGIDPHDLANQPGLWGAARQLGMLEFPARALRFLDALRGTAKRNPTVTTLRGHLLSVVGESQRAAESFQETVAVDPVSPLAHLMLSRLGLPTERSHRIDRLRRLLVSPPPHPEHVAMLQYALFNELDALGDIPAAWTALVAGAEARHRSQPYDAPAEAAVIDRLIETTENHAFARAPSAPSSDQSATPIFIVGLPRTGTTVLERILGNHPDVCTCGELTALAQQHQWTANRVWDGMFDLRAATEWQRLDAGVLGRRYLEATAWRTQGKLFFSDKTPANYMAIGLILEAMPNARVIHLYRDPMDACFSNYKMLFGPNVYKYSYSLAGLAEHHRNYTRLMAHWNRIFEGRILNLSYEDLVGNSAAHAARVLSYCGLSSRENIEDLTANRSAVSTESRSQVREGIHRRYVGSWRRYAHQLQPLSDLLARN